MSRRLVVVAYRGPSLQDLQAYLKQVPSTEVEPMPHGSQLLDDLVVKEIEKVVDAVQVRTATGRAWLPWLRNKVRERAVCG